MLVNRLIHFAAAAAFVVSLGAEPSAIEPLIRINQFGYLPAAVKVAVLADPVNGPNSADTYTPGSTLQVRRWSDDSVAFEGAPVPWNGGTVHTQSGDRGWWFDFSSLEEPGDYYLWDLDHAVGSYRFEISETVYNELLEVALRVFFYQRLAFAKEAEFAGDDWADGPAFIHPGQDHEIRSVYDRDNPDTERDLSGGWMDAGDYNKYVTFAESPVHDLLNAYTQNPSVFRDDYNIPESGNGIPDILDEVHFEMQWLARMQEPDGGVLLKMGQVEYNDTTPPSSDTHARYYVPVCSSSTIAAAGMYAHAALVFRDIEPWQEFASQLEDQAIAAWNHYFSNPRSTNCDDGTVKSGDADRSLQDQDLSALVAAMYLHMLTGESAYGSYVEQNYLAVNPFQSGFFMVYQVVASDAFLNYVQFPQAPTSVVETIETRVNNLGQSSGDAIIRWDDNLDLYRAHMPDAQYHWGSNNVKARFGSANASFEVYGYEGVDLAVRRKRAEQFLHYLCGVNPLGVVYLSNMAAYGAEHSITQVYHAWFREGSGWDTNPAPGYVPGGPNASYSGSRSGIAGNPPQKAYLDFNTYWPENSWEITEPAIYYQSAFVKLLSKFARPEPRIVDASDSDGDGLIASFERYFMLNPQGHDTLFDAISLEREGAQICLSYDRILRETPGLIRLQWSRNLDAWHLVQDADKEFSGVSNGIVTEKVRFELSPGENLFLRFYADGE